MNFVAKSKLAKVNATNNLKSNLLCLSHVPFPWRMVFRDKLLANHNKLMYPLFFIERARKRKFARHLQAKVYHKRCDNCPNLQKKFLLGRREFIF
jgi:hypothetical protein